MPPPFRLSIEARPAAVAGVMAAFGEYAEAQGVPVGVRHSMNVALDELLANTVSHGGAKQVTVDAEVKDDCLAVSVTDDGKAFNPFAKASPDTTLSVMVRPIGGLGIHLVKQMMDDVRYRRDGDHNVITMEKRLGTR